MDFQIAIEIDAPTDLVWSVMSDVERWPEWTASVRKVRRWQRTRPFAVGSRAVVWQPRMPPALWTVRSLTPGREFIWEAGVPGWRTIGGHRVETSGHGSRATLTITFQGGLARRFAPRLRPLVEQYVTWEAEGLKRRSEALAATVLRISPP